MSTTFRKELPEMTRHRRHLTKGLENAGLVLASVGLLSFTPELSVAKPKSQSGPTAIAALQGTCRKLIVAGRDVSEECSPNVFNTNYTDGRSGFYFVTTDGAAITFSGIGARQLKPNPDSAIQPIDMVIFGYRS